MTRYKVSENFYLDEFIGPSLHRRWGKKGIYWIDYKVIAFAQFMRENTGEPITINNWATGGSYKESGLRSFNTSTGSSLSQHKYGRAVDIKIQGWTSKELFGWVVNHWPQVAALGITTLEHHSMTKGNTRDWLHADCRNLLNLDLELPYVVYPAA